MSVVTGIMLLLGSGDWDEEPLREVQDWLRNSRRCQLKEISDGAGGGKHPQFEAWSAGINGFVEEDEFAAFVMSRSWRNPGNLVLVLQPEEGPSRVFVQRQRYEQMPEVVEVALDEPAPQT